MVQLKPVHGSYSSTSWHIGIWANYRWNLFQVWRNSFNLVGSVYSYTFFNSVPIERSGRILLEIHLQNPTTKLHG